MAILSSRGGPFFFRIYIGNSNYVSIGKANWFLKRALLIKMENC